MRSKRLLACLLASQCATSSPSKTCSVWWAPSAGRVGVASRSTCLPCLQRAETTFIARLTKGPIYQLLTLRPLRLRNPPQSCMLDRSSPLAKPHTLQQSSRARDSHQKGFRMSPMKFLSPNFSHRLASSCTPTVCRRLLRSPTSDSYLSHHQPSVFPRTLMRCLTLIPSSKVYCLSFEYGR